MSLGIAKDIALLIGYASSLVVIFGGIYKTLVTLSRQFQRRLDLRESRVLAQQESAVQTARAKGRAEGFSQCQEFWTALVCAAVLIFVFYYFSASAKSA